MSATEQSDSSRAEFDALENRISAAIAAADPAAFDPLALDLFRFQRAFNPAYDHYCELLGLTAPPDDWRQIPALFQSAFKHAALRTFPENEEVAAFRTSGTTGEGYGVHHFRSLRLYNEAILRGWDLLSLPPLPQITLIAAPENAPHSSLSHMMGVLKSRAPEGAQHVCFTAAGTLDFERLRDLLDRFRSARQPVLILGTALAFLNWFESVPGGNLLPAGSFLFETGGYKGSGRTLTKEALYQLFQRRLGLAPDQIINEYGMTELSSQCYTRGLGRPHTAPPWVRAIVVNPATGIEVADGETGILRIYDLANLGSLFAIQTRDLAIRRKSHFELLGRDPAALPRGCSRAADEILSTTR